MNEQNNLFLSMTAAERRDTEIDIYLLAGQSNAQGSTRISSAREGERETRRFANVRFCTRRFRTDGSVNRWDESFPPVAEGMGSGEDRIGPELGMARVMDDYYAQPGKKAVICKVAGVGISLLGREPMPEGCEISGGPLMRFQKWGSWYPLEDGGRDPFRPTGLIFRNFLGFYERIWQLLTGLGFKKVRFRAMVWMQGESDRRWPEAYPALFRTLISRVRADLTRLTGEDYSALPVLVGEISETFDGCTEEALAVNRRFIEMQHGLAAEEPDVHIVPTGGFALTGWEGERVVPLGSDECHWRYGDMLSVGELFGKACLQYGAKA